MVELGGDVKTYSADHLETSQDTIENRGALKEDGRMGRARNRKKLCKCGSGKKARFCCLAKPTPTKSHYRYEKISNEGSSSPRSARLLLGLPEIIEHTTLPHTTKEALKGKLLDFHGLLVAAETRVAPLVREIQASLARLEGGTTTFNAQDYPTNLPETENLTKATAFVKDTTVGLRAIREILGCRYGQFFTDTHFIDLKAFLRVRYPETDALNKLLDTDLAWIRALQDNWEQIQGGTSLISDFAAKRDGDKALISEPCIGNGSLIEFVNVHLENLFTFCEEMLSLSLAEVVHEKLAIHEIPESMRDKDCPQRFRIGLKAETMLKDLETVPELIHIFRSGQQPYHLREQARITKYGYVGPTLHLNYKGEKWVAVGSSLVHSKNWKTFVDFLHDFIKMCFGEKWWKRQVELLFERRSPVLKWAAWAKEHEKNARVDSDGLYQIDPNGPMHAYLSLAYDLYILAKHSALQPRMLRRLKIDREFFGARYEVSIAATCIKSGFKISFADETDGSRRHPEFSATHFMSPNQEFAVEAKCMQRQSATNAKDQVRLGFKDNLSSAFSKFDGRPLIVFLEMNLPPIAGNPLQQPWTKELLESATEAGGSDLETKKDKFNMIVYTNRPIGETQPSFPQHSHVISVSLVPAVPLSNDIPLRILADRIAKNGFIPSWFEE
jgi:hypothetical protein